MTSTTNSAVLEPTAGIIFWSREQEIDCQSSVLIGKMLAGTITPEESSEYQYLCAQNSARLRRVPRHKIVFKPLHGVTSVNREAGIDRRSSILIGKMLAGTITLEESAEYQYLQSERSKRLIRVRRR